MECVADPIPNPKMLAVIDAELALRARPTYRDKMPGDRRFPPRTAVTNPAVAHGHVSRVVNVLRDVKSLRRSNPDRFGQVGELLWKQPKRLLALNVNVS